MEEAQKAYKVKTQNDMGDGWNGYRSVLSGGVWYY